MIQTYSLKFPRIKLRTKLKLLALILIFLAFIFAFIYKDATYWSIAFLIIFVCGFWYENLTKSREDPKKYFSDNLIIGTNQISIAGTVYETNTINNLKININDFDGEEISMARGGKKVLNGTNNRLSFDYLDNHIYFQFYIVSEVQKEQYKDLFEIWYKTKFKFYEGNIGGRTYLLERLNYQQIQEFKKNYEII